MKIKKKWGGGGRVGGSGWGVRVDVNVKLKFLIKFEEKKSGGGSGGGGRLVGGSGWM